MKSLGGETPPEEERIPTATVVTYASPLLGVMLANALVALYALKFAADVLLLAPATAGVIFLAARVWDGVSDPMAGYLSDRTRTRLGRRRPWLLGSAVPMGLATAALWAPPETLGPRALLVWYALSVLAFYTAFTAFMVPHLALGAELSRGYHDRTRVFGIKQMVESTGFLLAAGVLQLLENAADPRATAAWAGPAMGALTAVLVLATALAVRERPEYQGLGLRPAHRALADVVRNPHSRILFGVFLLEQMAFTALITLMPFATQYVLKTPGRTGLLLVGAILAMAGSIPLWIVLSRRFGKQRLWKGSLFAKAGLFAALLGAGEGDFFLVLAITVGFGLAHGCSQAVGPSLKADVIDWDEVHSGERKEGSYFAAWNFAQKCAAGLAIWACGSVLQLVGFRANEAQDPSTLLGLQLLIAGFPFLLQCGAALLLLRFSLDPRIVWRARAASGGTVARPRIGPPGDPPDTGPS